MKNLQLQSLFSQLKSEKESDMEVLVINEESVLFGGTCPALTSCGSFTDCERKYKVRGGGNTCTSLVCCPGKYSDNQV